MIGLSRCVENLELLKEDLEEPYRGELLDHTIELLDEIHSDVVVIKNLIEASPSAISAEAKVDLVSNILNDNAHYK